MKYFTLKNLLAFFVILSAMQCLSVDTSTQTVFSNKKGIAAYNFTSEQTISKLKDLNVGWIYDWGVALSITGKAGYYAGPEEFVPMIWGIKDTTNANFDYLKQGKAEGKLSHLLAFNEPDRKDQANLSVEECLRLWPKLMETGLRLGSPAPAEAKWLVDFMDGAMKRGYRVDFISVHNYQDFTDPKALDTLKSWLTDIYNKYKRPVWLTEFGAADRAAWKMARIGTPTAEQAGVYMKKALDVLNSLPFVERYAWFADRCEGEYIYGTIYDRSGNITDFGTLYKNYYPALPRK